MIELRLSLGLECQVCLRIVDDENAIAHALLFGLADPYAMCPGCYREMNPTERGDPEYRRRARVAYFNKFGTVLREPEGAAR